MIEKSILIQIVDCDVPFPFPRHYFEEIHKFQFADVESEKDEAWDHRITAEQANKIIRIIRKAKEKKYNIIVHCFAGVKRSGAVVEAALKMGYKDTNTYRKPNQYITKTLLFAILNQFNDNDQYEIHNELTAKKLKLESK